jgi:hypothetical protein
MRLFENYLTGLDGVLSKKIKVTPVLLNEQRNLSSNIQKAIVGQTINMSSKEVPTVLNSPKVLFAYDRNFIEGHFGKNVYSFDYICIGAHPDFKELGELSYLNHHCVSVFVDIKGSTGLIEKYSLLEVRLIKDSLLTLAIQVANQFGGHVHRLHGDGVFLQFVRRNQNHLDSIINALNAASILTQFVTKDLAEIMNQYELRPLKIRVGLDYGADQDVLWSYYGIPGCGELTTTSLHTDMASKLQSKAYDNSILIGGNIKTELDLRAEFCSIYENETNKEKVYYISRQFTYPFFVFEWQEYLLSLPFIGKCSDGKTLEVREKPILIECYISNENGLERERYYPNSKAISKGKKITYQLRKGNSDYSKLSFERIEWYAHNSGGQATTAQNLFHDFGKLFENKTFCETSAAYLGHHFVECKIIRDHSGTERITFPIFVQ